MNNRNWRDLRSGGIGAFIVLFGYAANEVATRLPQFEKSAASALNDADKLVVAAANFVSDTGTLLIAVGTLVGVAHLNCRRSQSSSPPYVPPPAWGTNSTPGTAGFGPAWPTPGIPQNSRAEPDASSVAQTSVPAFGDQPPSGSPRRGLMGSLRRWISKRPNPV